MHYIYSHTRCAYLSLLHGATALGLSEEHYLGRRSALGIQLIVLHTTSLLAEIGLPSNHSLGLSLDPMLWISKLLPQHSLENLGKKRVWVLFIFLVMNDANQTQLIPGIQEHSLELGYLETRHLKQGSISLTS